MPLAENVAVYFAPANADAVGIVAEAMRIGAYLIVFYPADRSYRALNVKTYSEEVLELTGCIAGALSESELDGMLKEAGFTQVAFSPQRYDVFSDAPSESSAAEFGTQGVNVYAVKPR